METKNSATAGRELYIERTLNAPIDLVWEVWTNPVHIKNWWGPNGFTNTISKMDLEPGGEWQLVMHGPDGTDYKNRSIFREIVKHKKIVFDHVSGPKYIATITFEARGNKTHLTWHGLFESIEQFEQVVKVFKADEGQKQNVERLENYLQRIDNNNTEPLVFERVYNAPIEKVWSAISNKDEMKKWYFDLAEFRPEVGFKFSFSGGPPEKQYLHLCEVKDVVPNKRLSYSWRYDGYEGNSLVTFELFGEGQKTRLVLTHSGLHTFPSAITDFARKNFTAGWTDITGTLLKEYLEKNDRA